MPWLDPREAGAQKKSDKGEKVVLRQTPILNPPGSAKVKRASALLRFATALRVTLRPGRFDRLPLSQSRDGITYDGEEPHMLTVTINHRRGDRRWAERSLASSEPEAIAYGRKILDEEASAREFRVDRSWPTEYCPETITVYRETSWQNEKPTTSREHGRSI